VYKILDENIVLLYYAVHYLQDKIEIAEMYNYLNEAKKAKSRGEKPLMKSWVVAELARKFSELHGAPSWMTLFTRARHLSLS